MEKNNHHRGPGFGQGFLLGLVIGAALVFFLATKKGKQILKTLIENGVEDVEGLQEMLAENEEEEAFENDYSPEGETLEPMDEQVIVEKPTHRPLKRFFKGIKKISSN